MEKVMHLILKFIKQRALLTPMNSSLKVILRLVQRIQPIISFRKWKETRKISFKSSARASSMKRLRFSKNVLSRRKWLEPSKPLKEPLTKEMSLSRKSNLATVILFSAESRAANSLVVKSKELQLLEQSSDSQRFCCSTRQHQLLMKTLRRRCKRHLRML